MDVKGRRWWAIHGHDPDTLDLAKRAALVINALTGELEPDRRNAVYQALPSGAVPLDTREKQFHLLFEGEHFAQTKRGIG